MKKFQTLSHFFFVVGLLFAGCGLVAMKRNDFELGGGVVCKVGSPEQLANQKMQEIDEELNKKYPRAPSFVTNPIGRAKWEFWNNCWVQGGFRSALVGIPTTVLMGLICENVGEIPGKRIITKGSYVGGFVWGFSKGQQREFKRLGLQNKLIGTQNFQLTIQNFQTVQKNQKLIEANQSLLRAAVGHRKDMCGAMTENFGKVQLGLGVLSEGVTKVDQSLGGLSKAVKKLQEEMGQVKGTLEKMNKMIQQGFSDQTNEAKELQQLIEGLRSKQEEISERQNVMVENQSIILKEVRRNQELGKDNLKVVVTKKVEEKQGRKGSEVESLMKALENGDYFKKFDGVEKN